MTRRILVVIDKEDNKYLCSSDELKDNKYHHRYYDYDDDCMTSRWIDVKIDNEYLLNIHVEFLLDKDGSALHVDRGMREIYGLGYFYSVVLYDNRTSNVWVGNIIYKDNGIRCTDFDMYSYHSNDPFRYHSDMLEYEVYQSLDLKMLLTPQEKTPDTAGVVD